MRLSHFNRGNVRDNSLDTTSEEILFSIRADDKKNVKSWSSLTLVLMMIHAYFINRHFCKIFYFWDFHSGSFSARTRKLASCISFSYIDLLGQIPKVMKNIFYGKIWRFNILPNIFCMFDFITNILSCSHTATSNCDPVSNDSMTIFI